MAGAVVMVLLIPLNIAIAKKQKKLQITQMQRKDERIKIVSEMRT